MWPVEFTSTVNSPNIFRFRFSLLPQIRPTTIFFFNLNFPRLHKSNVLPVCKNTKVKKATTVYTTSSGTETVVSGRDLPRGSVRMPIPAVPYSLLAHPHFRFLWNTTKIINKHYFQPHFYSHTLQHWQNNQYLINQSHPISCCKLSTNNSVLLCVYCGSS